MGRYLRPRCKGYITECSTCIEVLVITLYWLYIGTSLSSNSTHPANSLSILTASRRLSSASISDLWIFIHIYTLLFAVLSSHSFKKLLTWNSWKVASLRIFAIAVWDGSGWVCGTCSNMLRPRDTKLWSLAIDVRQTSTTQFLRHNPLHYAVFLSVLYSSVAGRALSAVRSLLSSIVWLHYRTYRLLTPISSMECNQKEVMLHCNGAHWIDWHGWAELNWAKR